MPVTEARALVICNQLSKAADSCTFIHSFIHLFIHCQACQLNCCLTDCQVTMDSRHKLCFIKTWKQTLSHPFATVWNSLTKSLRRHGNGWGWISWKQTLSHPFATVKLINKKFAKTWKWVGLDFMETNPMYKMVPSCPLSLSLSHTHTHTHMWSKQSLEHFHLCTSSLVE